MATELHRWTLDESGSTITDHVGSSDGTVNGTPDEVEGVLGGARYFGTGEYIDCGDPSDLNFGSNDFTIRSIFRRSSASASYDQYICSKHTVASPGYAFYIDQSSKTIEFVIYFSGTPYTVSATDPFDNGLFHDAVVTRDGTDLTLYVGAVAVDSTTVPATAADTSSANFYIGNGAEDTSKYFLTGDVDHVQVWSGALTSAEISELLFPEVTLAGSLSLASTSPVDLATSIAIDTSINLIIEDDANSIVISGLELLVDGQLAYFVTSGGFQSGWDGPGSVLVSGIVSGVDTFDFTIDPTSNFNYEDNIVVDIYATNDIGGILDTSFSFDTVEDTSPPTLENLNPASGITGVARNSSIYFEIYEPDTAVEPTSLTFYVDHGAGGGSVLAYDNDGGGFQTGFAGSVSPDIGDGAKRYNVTINPDTDFGENKTIEVRVVADNTSPTPATLDRTYFFTSLADTGAPMIENADPPNGESDAAPSTDIYFEIYDSDVGVSTNSIIIYVDRGEGSGYELVWDISQGGWQAGWNGSIVQDPVEGINRFLITINPDTDFVSDNTVSVSGVASDIASPTPNEMVSVYSFVITELPYITSVLDREYGHPVWEDLSLDVNGGGGNIILDSIAIQINDILVYDGNGGGFQTDWDGTNSLVTATISGYHFVIDPVNSLDTSSFHTVTVTGVNDLGYTI